VFTSSGTFTVPAGVTSITIELIGAGGNGAQNGGGGGGGGAYVRGVANVTPGQTISFVVGEGGSGLATIAGGLGMLANAGANGTTVANPNLGGGGVGGTGLGGQIARTGGAGGGGYWTYFGGGGGGAAGPSANGFAGGNTIVYNGTNCLTPGGAGGASVGGPSGAGGKGAGFTDNACTVTDPVANGGDYGGGGGGGNGIGSPAGIGGGGLAIVTWAGSTGVEALQKRVAEPAGTLFTDRIILRDATGQEYCALFDASGRSIWSGVRIAQQDFSALSTGAYFLHVTGNAGDRVYRLVKAMDR
jgi:hypothetical protein